MLKDSVRKMKTRIWIELSPQGFVNGYILFPIRRQLKKMGLGDRDLEKIKSLKDIHKGKRCFVIATGPSLRIEDIKKIENEYTIGINSIFKLYGETSWRPTYYAMTDYNLTNAILKEHTIPIDDYARSKCFVNIIILYSVGEFPFRLASLGTSPYGAGKKDIRAINISQ